ncbi:MAG: hypothetical protein V1663_04190 [archaeon]
MRFNKLWIFLIMLISIIPIVSANIQLVEQDREIYNLNSDYLLDAVVSVSNQLCSNLNCLLKTTLYCNDYTLEYFVIPVTTTTTLNINIPDIKINNLMIGNCYVQLSLEDSSGNMIEWKDSKGFEVTDQLLVVIGIDKNTFLPGERVNVDGTVKYVIEENVNNFQYDLMFDNNEFNNIDSSNGEFGYMFDLSETIKTGEHTIKVTAYDDYGNKGESNVNLFVNAVPSQLKNSVNDLEFLPSERLEVKALLYDQAGDMMDEYTTINIYNKNGQAFSKNVKTNELVVLDLDKQAVPGEWRIVTESRGLEIESKFNVLPVKDLEVFVYNNILIIKNIGNVKFEGSFTAYLDDFSFTRMLKLDVNDFEETELKGKVKGGEYNLKVYANSKEYDLGTVTIVDNRGFFEKTGDIITGNVVAVGINDFFSNYISYFIVIVILVVVFLIWQNKKRKNINRIREKEIIEGQLKIKNIKGEREPTKGKSSKGMFSSAKNINREEAKEFRDNLFKVAQEDNNKKDKKDSWY